MFLLFVSSHREIPTPVSYTHLDVYKRQGLMRKMIAYSSSGDRFEIDDELHGGR